LGHKFLTPELVLSISQQAFLYLWVAMNVFVFILATLRRQKSIRRWEDRKIEENFRIIPSFVNCCSFVSNLRFLS
jgi:hypothetical protein